MGAREDARGEGSWRLMRILIYAIAAIGGLIVGCLILWAIRVGWTEKDKAKERDAAEEYEKWLS